MDLLCLLRLRSIDIKVFQTFFSLILCILSILAILLQTIAIKVLRTFSPCFCCGSIDIKVFQTFASSSWPSCKSCSSCFRQTSGTAEDRPPRNGERLGFYQASVRLLPRRDALESTRGAAHLSHRVRCSPFPQCFCRGSAGEPGRNVP